MSGAPTTAVNRTMWRKVTKGQTGMRWDKEVQKVWKGIVGNVDKVLSIRKVRYTI